MLYVYRSSYIKPRGEKNTAEVGRLNSQIYLELIQTIICCNQSYLNWYRLPERNYLVTKLSYFGSGRRRKTAHFMEAATVSDGSAKKTLTSWDADAFWLVCSFLA